MKKIQTLFELDDTKASYELLLKKQQHMLSLIMQLIYFGVLKDVIIYHCLIKYTLYIANVKNRLWPLNAESAIISNA